MKSISLEEPDLNDDNFFEFEEKVLSLLPRKAQSLNALLAYLETMDSYNAYEVLFLEFYDFMDKSAIEEIKDKVKSIFGEEAVANLFQYL